MLERSLGFAFNLNDYPGAIKLYLQLIYFFIHLFNLFCEKTIINCICTGWIANNNIIIHDNFLKIALSLIIRGKQCMSH